MWGSIVALYGRYPHALAHLKDVWWEGATHVETLCALVVWRDWIDQAAEDPRHELAFHAQLSDYSRELRQEGGGVTRAWQPAAASQLGPLTTEDSQARKHQPALGATNCGMAEGLWTNLMRPHLGTPPRRRRH
jgi:hypothetical protein